MPSCLCGHHVGHAVRLEAASGDHLLPIPHLDGEGMEGPLEDGIRAVVERCQQWPVAILVDQHIASSKQLGGQLSRGDPGSSCVEPAFNCF